MTTRFSASSAARLLTCHGSANLELAIPGFVPPVRDDITPNAKNIGTQVHEVLRVGGQWESGRLRKAAEAVLLFQEMHHTKRKPLLDDANKMSDWLRSNALEYDVTWEWAQQLVFAPKMLRFISDALNYMADLTDELSNMSGYCDWMVEEQLTAAWLPSQPGTTPDLSITSDNILHVLDYKTGVIPVDAEMNDQLLYYAACKLPMAPDATEFTLHIVQPGNNSRWTAPISVLHEWMNDAINADRAILAKDLTLKPSKNCTFCPANPHGRGDKGYPFCPAMMSMLYPPIVDEAEIFAEL